MDSISNFNALYRRRGKRLFDVAIALLGSAFLGPVAVVLSALIWRQMGSPVLFRQRRPGIDGNPFVMYKFRTMNNAVDASGNLLPDADRLTSLGRWLRATSLDELPELINVLKGDMSLVGPRPLLMQYLDRYTPQQARRHEVLPGITGWAQVNGRNTLSWGKKFEYDVWYVEHVSIWLDMHILYRTVALVLSRSGISQPGSATASEYRGEQDE